MLWGAGIVYADPVLVDTMSAVIWGGGGCYLRKLVGGP